MKRRIYALALLLLLAACSQPATETATRTLPPPTPTPELDNEDYRQARENLVAGIDIQGVHDPDVLRAMRAVLRHQFVPREYLRQAYEDHALPIGYGQTISQPYVVAWMTELLELQPGEKVLEIGTGSGYQSAYLSHLTDKVWSIEKQNGALQRVQQDRPVRAVHQARGRGHQGHPQRRQAMNISARRSTAFTAPTSRRRSGRRCPRAASA